jgi:hypothetical protein
LSEEFDEIHLGNMVLKKTDAGCGIFISSTYGEPGISIVCAQGRSTIGIHHPGRGNCAIGMGVDAFGAGYLQVSNDKGDLVMLSYEDIVKLKSL